MEKIYKTMRGTGILNIVIGSVIVTAGLAVGILAIVSGAVLSFVSIITEMSSGVILYNNSTITLTIGTYAAVSSGIYGVAAVFATITLLVTVLCLIVYLRFTKLEDVRM